ncbi:MAG TPA: cohesin domain-containing protein, partial [Candidatus Paceibacterota bacterium]|nr:cohesin domain-containing protein [Candidatus Paceibacterota bacterium]
MMKGFARFVLLSFALEAAAFSIPAHAAGSASLSIIPATGSHAPGSIFTASVMLDSGGGVGVNAADGDLAFDPSLLAVQSVSKANSVFNLWVADPTFSNTDGSVTFSGGSTSAYTGSSGDVIDITFKALKAGSADVKFTSGSALAADGQGTDVLGSKNSATFTIGGASVSSNPAPTPTPTATPDNSASAVAAAPPFTVSIAVTSATHPDPTQWYANNNPVFTWQLTSDIASVSTAFDRNPGTYPRRSSEGLLSTKQYSNIGEGTWYFHVRFEDSLGDWSDPVNYGVRIDDTPPGPFTVNVETGAGVSGRTLLVFNATDTVSGVDHYVATFDGVSSTTIALSDVQSGVYTAPPLLPGKHLVNIKAVDKAGNSSEANAAFELQGVAMPNITNFPATVIEKSPIVLEGIADSGSNVTVDINDAGNKVVSEGKMVADETGHWLYAVEGGLSTGKYSLGVSMVTVQGASASSTMKGAMDVIPAPFLDRFGLVLIVILLACIGGLVTFGFYKKKLIEMQFALAKRENEEAREKAKAVFEALREEVDDQISHMEGGAAQAQGEVKLEPEQVLDAMR